MIRAVSLALSLVALVSATACTSVEPPTHAFFPFESLRGVLRTPPQELADDEPDESEESAEQPNAIVLAIDDASSYRAVANAVLRVRERDLPVGFWIDCGPGADFEQRVARVHDLLEKHVRADAIFLVGLAGPRAACGCGSLQCCSDSARSQPHDVHEAARFVASVRSSARGALVVPVWLDGCAPLANECAARGCVQPECASSAARAWEPVRAASLCTAVLLDGRGFRSSVVGNLGLPLAQRLEFWSREGGPPPIAVLDAAGFEPAEFARAVQTLAVARRGGVLLRR